MTRQAIDTLADQLGLKLEYKGFSMVRIVGENKWYRGFKVMYSHMYNKKKKIQAL